MNAPNDPYFRPTSEDWQPDPAPLWTNDPASDPMAPTWEPQAPSVASTGPFWGAGVPTDPGLMSDVPTAPVWIPADPLSAASPAGPGGASSGQGPSGRRPQRASRAVLVAALCLISAASGAVAGVGAVQVLGSKQATPSTASSSPDARALSDAATPTPSAATPSTAATTPSASATTPTSALPTPSTASAGATSADQANTVQIAANVAPAVVTIEVQASISGGRGSPPSGGGTTPGSGQVAGSGSGIILTSDGWILTNHHVVSTASSVTVTLSDNRQFQGTVKGIDTYTDFALVKISATGLPTATLGNSSDVRIGQSVLAIGSPLGEFPGSVTEGIVSGLDRSIDVANDTGSGSTALFHLIQTDAAINPGNSGGALVDSQGLVIGVNTAEAGSAQNIGFALPIDLAKPIIQQALAGQPIARPWLGVVFQDVDAQLAKDQNLGVDHGAWVSASQSSSTPSVVPNGPAAKAGLKDGDIIVAVDGQSVDATHPLDLLTLVHQPGDTVQLSVFRNGSTIQLTVTLGTRPAALGSLQTTGG